jgi:hypothetical protein
MKRLVLAAMLSCVLLVGCKDDPEQAANKLFVEAAALFEEYQALRPDNPAQYKSRLKLLTQVATNLDSILGDYPGSSLAVDLASTGKARQLVKKEIDDDILRLQQSIPASVLMAETLPLWEQYKSLPTNDPAQYAAQLELLTMVDANLDRLLHEFPDSYQATGLSINAQQIKDEIPRLQQSIPASELMAETLPLWQQYKALPTYDPTQYAAQLELLTKVDANLDRLLHEFPDSYQATGLSINPQFIKDELPLLEGYIRIEKATSLVKRAEAQSSAGDVEGARSTLSEALKITRSITDYDLRTRTLSEILSASAKLK